MKELCAGAGGCLKEGCGSEGSPPCSRLLADLWPCEESCPHYLLQQICKQDLCLYGKGPVLLQFLKDCSPWRDPTLEQEKKSSAQGGNCDIDNVWWADHNPIPHPPALPGRAGRESGRRREKVVLGFVLLSVILLWFWLVINSTNFPKCLACDGNCYLSLLLAHEPFITVVSSSSPVQLRSDRSALVGIWHPARSKPPQKLKLLHCCCHSTSKKH